MSKNLDFGHFTRPQRGLIVGRFLPPHLGHQYLFDFARAYCEHLDIVVESRADEPIPAATRLAWIRELCPGASVHAITAEIPRKTPQATKAWELEAPKIRQLLPSGVDVVFSSENYGDELARHLGARHVRVDVERELVPISAEELRAAPLKHWRFLPACVRPHFVKRVVICGPESTGKSTLCRDLARHYETAWVGEYVRTYLDHKTPAPAVPLCEPSDLAYIMHGQHASEEALSRQAQRVMFLDTDALQTVMYSRFYFGSCPDELVALAASRSHDLYLVLDVDVPWVFDRQRDMPYRRDEILQNILSVLDEHQRPYVVISGNWQERQQKARAAVDHLLRED